MTFHLLPELQALYYDGYIEAKRGKECIDKFLNSNDDRGLAYLLRHHSEQDISNGETWVRDDIDFFIQYYSIVSIAVMMGSISMEEFNSIRPQVAYYLGNISVKRYYTKNYPLLLPEVLFFSALSEKPFIFGDGTDFFVTFPIFHQLNQQINNDDVYRFLWFLDGGSTGRYDLDDLIKVVQDMNKYKEILKNQRNTPLRQSVVGFIDFLVFIEDFYRFIETISNPVYKSAYWHFYGYWFKKIEKNLNKTIRSFFLGLSRLAESSSKEEGIQYRDLLMMLETGKNDYLNIIDTLVSSDKNEKPLKKEFEQWLSGSRV